MLIALVRPSTITPEQLRWNSAALLIYKVSQASEDPTNDANSMAEFNYVIHIVAESGILFLSVTIALFVVWFTTNDLAIRIITAFVRLPLVFPSQELINNKFIERTNDRNNIQHHVNPCLCKPRSTLLDTSLHRTSTAFLYSFTVRRLFTPYQASLHERSYHCRFRLQLEQWQHSWC